MISQAIPVSLAALIVAAVFLNAASCARTGAAQSDQDTPTTEVAQTASASSLSSQRASQETKIQVGPWVPQPANTEEPFINILHAGGVSWTETDEVNTQELYDTGVLDPVTGLPQSLPNGWMRSGVYFSTWPDKSHWAGEWVLEWETEKPNNADLLLHWFPGDKQYRAGRSRVEFSRSPGNDHAAIAITRLKSPLTAVRMFRKENEAALRAGKIYNPRFIAEVAKYHVVRTMDLQEANRTAITRVDELSTMEACCWNNTAWKGPPRRTDHPFRDIPLKALFALAVEADNILWHHAPMELGSPKRLHDPSIMDRDNNDNVAGAWRAHARENAAEILASSEWDAYADKFVAALAASGYPEERPLYTTVSNEVWNTAFHYFVSTNYAWGLGQGFQENGHFRHGYGAALARWKLALDGALTRAGRAQPVIYVAEGQAANTSTTWDALGAMKRFLEQNGEAWDDHAPEIGISVASYWGGGPNWNGVATPQQWQNAGESEAIALTDRLLNGPASELATKAWILKRFEDHAKAGEQYGVKIIGAYEGGSHLEKPGYVPREFYEQWLWGEHGARVNKGVNDALAAAYPGIILSNYVLAGPTGGQPWFDGQYGETTEMNRSWSAYQRR